jgi:hypothetical protein
MTPWSKTFFTFKAPLGTTKPAGIHPDTGGVRPTCLPIPGLFSRPFGSPRRGILWLGFDRVQPVHKNTPPSARNECPLTSSPRCHAAAEDSSCVRPRSSVHLVVSLGREPNDRGTGMARPVFGSPATKELELKNKIWKIT